jgi:hypothetical protein
MKVREHNFYSLGFEDTTAATKSRAAYRVRRTALRRAGDTSIVPTQYAVRCTQYVFSFTPNATLQIRYTGEHYPKGTR